MTDYDLAAQKITSLRVTSIELQRQWSELDDGLSAIHDAHHYMMALIEVIKANPGLLVGWQRFLAAANIEEPEWKHDYENEYV